MREKFVLGIGALAQSEARESVRENDVAALVLGESIQEDQQSRQTLCSTMTEGLGVLLKVNLGAFSRIVIHLNKHNNISSSFFLFCFVFFWVANLRLNQMGWEGAEVSDAAQNSLENGITKAIRQAVLEIQHCLCCSFDKSFIDFVLASKYMYSASSLEIKFSTLKSLGRRLRDVNETGRSNWTVVFLSIYIGS